MKSVHIQISGRVQGVFFRVYTQKFARELTDVTGFVRNLHDGRVEIFAEGSKESLSKLELWAQKEGSPSSRITKTDISWTDIRTRKFKEFEIKY